MMIFNQIRSTVTSNVLNALEWKLEIQKAPIANDRGFDLSTFWVSLCFDYFSRHSFTLISYQFVRVCVCV